MSSITLKKKSSKDLLKLLSKNKGIYILILPALIYFAVFSYFPIVNGFMMSLQHYSIGGEHTFAGLVHYREILTDIDFWRAFRNTLQIGGGNLIVGFIMQVLLALLLNEITHKKFKKLTQTIIYTPNLFSWVAIGGIWISLLAPDTGMVNEIIKWFGMEPINFMTNVKIIQPVFIFLNTWKSAGYGCIIFLAAITGIDKNLYEAAAIDGASRFKQTLYITIPGLYSTMKVVFMLNLISVLRMFSQSYVLTNYAVIDKTQVAMTYTYSMGIENFRMDYGSAIAFIMLLFTSVFVLIYQMFVRKKEVD
ncbi:ABC transporter permease subunit [Vallitalea guaymasensis]|uniref:ABC transporter permease subunit n=1 Tax=Vallitalea guaymasensis TaxID=1185412 RepID=UPI001BAF280E|nr:ABC transporter permease subunit [Vallitalea guaymasensis]